MSCSRTQHGGGDENLLVTERCILYIRHFDRVRILTKASNSLFSLLTYSLVICVLFKIHLYDWINFNLLTQILPFKLYMYANMSKCTEITSFLAILTVKQHSFLWRFKIKAWKYLVTHAQQHLNDRQTCDAKHWLFMLMLTIKFLKIRTPQKFAVIILNVE